ncbi:MAG: MaoC family dehydratase [Chloroflexi bacterium]|nr:MaoC family dehydratase [Chloroflexota bacterium]
MTTKETFGRYLEEFTVGEVIEHWPGRSISEADDILFCMLTMNHHPLHSDRAYGAGTQFKNNLVAGPYVYSLVFGMTVSDISGKAIANLATKDLTHPAPVFHGDTLYARTEVLEVRESKSQPDRGIATVKTTGTNQDGKTVIAFTRAVMVPKRG